MKKPNITEGEWQEVAPNAVGSITIKEDVCYVVNTKNDNINAISAVPDMLDALIKAHEILNPFDEEASNVKADIANALKKAGVEL